MNVVMRIAGAILGGLPTRSAEFPGCAELLLTTVSVSVRGTPYHSSVDGEAQDRLREVILVGALTSD